MLIRAFLAIAAATLLAGCTTTAKTETGYEPRRLGMSDGQRKALYAPRYSPEAAAAHAEREAELKAKKPGGLFN